MACGVPPCSASGEESPGFCPGAPEALRAAALPLFDGGVMRQLPVPSTGNKLRRFLPWIVGSAQQPSDDGMMAVVCPAGTEPAPTIAPPGGVKSLPPLGGGDRAGPPRHST